MVRSQHQVCRTLQCYTSENKVSLWRMFCIGVVISAWAISDLIRCSAGACCEQLFSQEKRTNNPVIRTVDLP